MIPFNLPTYTGKEDQYVISSMRSNKISGDGNYGLMCHKWFEDYLNCEKVLLTPSCTHALEMAAILVDIQPGDEVIMPSYTFVSTANAFVLRGAKVVFVDIRPDTMNIDQDQIESAITNHTKAIVVVHYAGVVCDMERILEIANNYGLFVIEDAAQAMLSTYKNRAAGTLGHIATYSFHETKNFTSGGEGGLLIINDKKFVSRAEIIREKGTNRNQFFRGMVDKYSWVDIGSSYLLSDLQAAYLWAQLTMANEIIANRMITWNFYKNELGELESKGYLDSPTVPSYCTHNAHMFYIKVADLDERTDLIEYLRFKEINTVFHYVPLHSAAASSKFSRFNGNDRYTTKESERLIRLPLWYGMPSKLCETIVSAIIDYF